MTTAAVIQQHQRCQGDTAQLGCPQLHTGMMSSATISFTLAINYIIIKAMMHCILALRQMHHMRQLGMRKACFTPLSLCHWRWINGSSCPLTIAQLTSKSILAQHPPNDPPTFPAL